MIAATCGDLFLSVAAGYKAIPYNCCANMNQLHVVVGATGALGQALTLRLISEQAPVRAVVRSEERGREILPESIEMVSADATDLTSLQAACADAAVIYNCVYVSAQNWPGVTENFIVAARETGARLVFPSNIHPYGPLQQNPALEDHPLGAQSERGKLRVKMERTLIDAHHNGDAQVVIPRLAALYGPTMHEGFLAMIFESALAKRKAWWYGSLDMPYDLLYTDDAATACFLLGTAEGAAGQVWHVPGAGALSGREFITQVYEAAGAKLDMSTRGRGMFQLLGLVYPPARAMLEVLYEFEQPLVMDGSKFARAFPDFAYTPHAEAIRETLGWFKQK
jgi:nucleoside-diphosphate-sugar epimerase